jgi:mono/diheme cytochrome c family protein
MLSRTCDPTLVHTRESSLGRHRLSRFGSGLSAFATLGVMACLVTINFSRAEPGAQSEQASPPPAKDTTAAGLYQRLCQSCHGDAGKGQRGARADNVPDFTASSFHAQRSDPQLLVSILEGKGKGMPAFHGKLTEAQARTLTAYVRSFDPDRSKMRSTGEKTRSDFEVQFQQLQNELEDLRGQLDKLMADKRGPEKKSKAQTAKTETGNGRQDGLPNAAGYTGGIASAVIARMAKETVRGRISRGRRISPAAPGNSSTATIT